MPKTAATLRGIVVININSSSIEGYLELIDRLAGGHRFQIETGLGEVFDGVLIGIVREECKLKIQIWNTTQTTEIPLASVWRLDLVDDNLPPIQLEVQAPGPK